MTIKEIYEKYDKCRNEIYITALQLQENNEINNDIYYGMMKALSILDKYHKDID